jgi:hypothetical protein
MRLGSTNFAVFLLSLLSLFGPHGCVAAEAATSVTEEFMNDPDRPAIVRGDYFKAISVAYSDFAKILSARASLSESHQGDPVLERRLSQIENYDIHVEQTQSTFIVWFRPTMRDPAHVAMGGGATYTIDRNTFAIAHKTLSK